MVADLALILPPSLTPHIFVGWIFFVRGVNPLPCRIFGQDILLPTLYADSLKINIGYRKKNSLVLDPLLGAIVGGDPQARIWL